MPAQTRADSTAMRPSLALFALVLAGAACAPTPEENAPGVTLTERSTFRVDLAGVGELRRGTNQFVVRTTAKANNSHKPETFTLGRPVVLGAEGLGPSAGLSMKRVP